MRSSIPGRVLEGNILANMTTSLACLLNRDQYPNLTHVRYWDLPDRAKHAAWWDESLKLAQGCGVHLDKLWSTFD